MTQSNEHQRPPEPFEKLDMPHKEVPHTRLSRYRVYSDPKRYIVVEAESALEALKASGLPEAFRIMRDALYFMNVLKKDEFIGSFVPAASNSAPVEEAPAQPLTQSESPTEAPQAAASTLSNTDVDRLLQG